ncbi:MAG TPA: DUF503 domain-containing protein [Candidatus Glassbacteria bacterium]|nr:DUF503 domain-containing protein [Candidatus Glassbacteria bacterium]
MPVVIGVCTYELYLGGIQSLKAKRGVLKRLKARIAGKFNVSVAEVEAMDSWQRSTVAVAIVSNEQRFANQVLSKVSELVAANGDVMLVSQKMQFL